jgi:hypothetical protein
MYPYVYRDAYILLCQYYYAVPEEDESILNTLIVKINKATSVRFHSMKQKP